ncbi:MAG: PsbP-related protein [Promethearchaeota archaeon]
MNFLNYEIKLVENLEHGIKIKFPSKWEMKENIMDAIVVFLTPIESKLDKFRENLSIMIKMILVEPRLLDEYIEFEINQLKKAILDFRLVEKKKTKLAKIPAYKLVFTGKKQEITLKLMQYYALKYNIVYLMTYTAEKYKYDKYLKIILKMIKSFKII